MFISHGGAHGPKPPYEVDWSSPQSEGLIGWWPFERPATVQKNRVFQNYQGTLAGTSPEIKPTALGLYGLDVSIDERMQLGTAIVDEFVAENKFTLSAWVYNRDLTADGAVFGCWLAQETVLIWQDTGGVDGYAALVKGGGVTTRCGEAVASSIANTWQHVAATWDGTNIRIYVDGTQRDTDAGALTLNSPAAGLALGTDYESTGARALNGVIVDPRVYKAVLPADVIFQMWHPSTRWELFKPVRRNYFAPIPIYTQANYRFRNDDGDLGAPPP